MTNDRVYVLVAVDKRALTRGQTVAATANDCVRSWVGHFLFDDQFAVADVTDLVEPYLVHEAAKDDMYGFGWSDHAKVQLKRLT